MNEISATGRTVAENVLRLRKARGLSTTQLSKLLGEVGRPIQPTGITKIEKRERRVDVDDLMALASVLRVNPSALLLPIVADGETEITGVGSVPTEIAWCWADGEGPIASLREGERYSEAALDFLLHARPPGRRDLTVK